MNIGKHGKNRVRVRTLWFPLMVVLGALVYFGMRGTLGSSAAQRVDAQDISFGFEGFEKTRIRAEAADKNNESFAVYLPSGFGNVRVFCPGGCTLTLDGIAFRNGDDAGNAQNPGSHTFALRKDADQSLLCGGSLTVYEAKQVGTMLLEVKKGSLDEVHADPDGKTRLAGTCQTRNADGTLDSGVGCTLRGHGNLTWTGGMQKRAYRIDLERSTGFLGMGEQREWVLLSDWFDPSFLNNRIALESARMLECPYTPEDSYVNLYVDGCYRGLYQLAQKISMDSGTLDRAGADGEWLLEFDFYGRMDHSSPGFETVLQYVSVKYPKSLSPIDLDMIRNRTVLAEQAVMSHSDACVKWLDITSFASQYLLREVYFEKDVDYSSMYFYKRREDPLFYAGPAWDFDRLLGRDDNTLDYAGLETSCLWIPGMTGESEVGSGWYRELYETPVFFDEMARIYRTRFSDLLEELADRRIPAWEEELRSSVVMDHAKYRSQSDGAKDQLSSAETAFGQGVARASGWLRERKAFLDALWIDQSPFAQVVFYSRWIEDNGHDLICCISPGGTLPAVPAADGIVGWCDENARPVRAGERITGDITLYPVYERQEDIPGADPMRFCTDNTEF